MKEHCYDHIVTIYAFILGQVIHNIIIIIVRSYRRRYCVIISYYEWCVLLYTHLLAIQKLLYFVRNFHKKWLLNY